MGGGRRRRVQERESVPQVLPFLPPEMWQEIMARVPLEVAMTSKLVCMAMKEVLSYPSLPVVRSKKFYCPVFLSGKRPQGWDMDFGRWRKLPSMSFLPTIDKIPSMRLQKKIICSCFDQGLLCITKENQIYVCNMLTSEFISIPNLVLPITPTIEFMVLKGREKGFSLFYISHCDYYHLPISMAVFHSNNQNQGWQVLPSPNFTRLACGQPILVKDVIFCMSEMRILHGRAQFFLHSFHVEKQVWTDLCMPILHTPSIIAFIPRMKLLSLANELWVVMKGRCEDAHLCILKYLPALNTFLEVHKENSNTLCIGKLREEWDCLMTSSNNRDKICFVNYDNSDLGREHRLSFAFFNIMNKTWELQAPPPSSLTYKKGPFISVPKTSFYLSYRKVVD